MSLPTPYAVALLAALNIQRYSAEKGKSLGRVRLSRSTLCAISKRKTFRRAFMDELHESLESLGWMFFELPDGGFAMLDSSSVSSWTKISSSRVSKEAAAVAKGRLSEEELENALEIDEEAASDGE